MASTIYDTNLDKNPANYQPLTPLAFLERAAAVHPERIAVVHGALQRNYRDFYARSRRLASALARRGIGRGDTVSVMLPNTPAMLECHYGVPMTGAVLNTLNTRLDAKIIAFSLAHGEAKVLITDREFSATVKAALASSASKPLVIDYDDPEFTGAGERLGSMEYEEFLAEGDPDFAWSPPRDEWDAITLNYTSGTTGDPKGVVYHHRGAYLLSLGNILTAGMGQHPVYLWTLPMFHCNGWCFPWSLSIVAGTHVCLRAVRAKPMYDAFADNGVTHLCGAPIVMSTLLNAPAAEKRPLPHMVKFMTAAAPPPEAVLAAMKAAGFDVTHLYGLTEVYGPAVVNEWHEEWDALDPSDYAAKKARQGVRYPVLEELDVLDPRTLQPVPCRREDPRRGHVPRQCGDEGLSQEPGRNRQGLRGRLVPFRRSRREISRRLRAAEGPLEGHHHLGRREHLLHRGGGCALQAPGHSGCGRGGDAGREMGRDPLRLRGAEARSIRVAGGYRRLVPRAPRFL